MRHTVTGRIEDAEIGQVRARHGCIDIVGQHDTKDAAWPVGANLDAAREIAQSLGGGDRGCAGQSNQEHSANHVVAFSAFGGSGET
jgi:hypothetical protein